VPETITSNLSFGVNVGPSSELAAACKTCVYVTEPSKPKFETISPLIKLSHGMFLNSGLILRNSSGFLLRISTCGTGLLNNEV